MTALKRLKKNPYDRKKRKEVRELEEFFHSDWYELLTDVDPDYLIRKLREKAGVS